jgi:hypothetical protein
MYSGHSKEHTFLCHNFIGLSIGPTIIFRDVKKQDCHGLLSSLVSQLSVESDSCYNVLSKLYADNGRSTWKPGVGALKKC